MRVKFLVSAIISILFFFSPAFADSIGKVVAVAGSPTASGPGGNRTLAAGADIQENDKVTVTTGNAQILFSDGTKLVVGPGSSLVISKFLMRGGGNTAQDFSVNALRGTFRFITGKSPKSAYNIQTANATIGIRGTGFDFWVNNATGVAVMLGKVRLCNKGGDHKCVDLNPNCELGTTENASAKKFSNDDQGRRLRNHLPSIVNQAPLNKIIWRGLNSCKSILSKTDPAINNDSGTAPQNRCRQKCG